MNIAVAGLDLSQEFQRFAFGLSRLSFCSGGSIEGDQQFLFGPNQLSLKT